MNIIFEEEKIKSQDNVAFIKNFINEYENNFDETVCDIETEDDTNIETTEKEVVKKERKSPYHVVLASGLDTIIEKKTKSKTIQLILMPSQDKYLLKLDDIIQDILSITEAEFKNFFKVLKKDEKIEINNVVFQSIKKDDISYVYKMINEYRALLSKGMMSYPFYKRMHGLNTEYSYYYRRTPDIYNELLANEKILKCLCTKTPILEGSEKYGENFIHTVLMIDNDSGYDAARYFAESYTKASVNNISFSYYGYNCIRYNRGESVSKIFSNKYGLNLKRLTDYLCFDLYGQGYSTIPLTEYKDYLDMAYAFYDGKIKDKYPKALSTMHDVMAQNVKQNDEIIAILERNRKTEYEIEKAKEEDKRIKLAASAFDEKYNEFKKNIDVADNQIFEYNNIFIKIPDDPRELILEGNNLGHCVATYIPRVANGECLILFARKKNEPDNSYLTVEIRHSGISTYKGSIYSIAQVQGDSKRTTLSKEEKTFFKKFMEKFEIVTTNPNFR